MQHVRFIIDEQDANYCFSDPEFTFIGLISSALPLTDSISNITEFMVSSRLSTFLLDYSRTYPNDTCIKWTPVLSGHFQFSLEDPFTPCNKLPDWKLIIMSQNHTYPLAA